MDTQVQAPNPPPPTTQPVISNPSSAFGKIVVIIVVMCILIGGGVYLGTRMNKPSRTSQNAPVIQTPTLSALASPTTSLSQAPTVTLPLVALKLFTAGGVTGTQFGAYQLRILADWAPNHETTSTMDKLTITKAGYSLIINQGAFGGGGCTYPGEPAQEMAQPFTDFVGIMAQGIQYRRSWNKTGNPAGTVAYTICQASSDNSYGTITSFGRIDATSPDPADPAIMTQIDSMIASIAKK